MLNTVEGAIDMFNTNLDVKDQVIEEYYLRNKRKTEDEKWLKENRISIIEALNQANKTKHDLNDLRISISVPNESKFDETKLVSYLQSKFNFNTFLQYVDFKPNEDKVLEAVNTGLIDLEEMRNSCWIEKQGTPRLTIKKLKKSDIDAE